MPANTIGQSVFVLPYVRTETKQVIGMARVLLCVNSDLVSPPIRRQSRPWSRFRFKSKAELVLQRRREQQPWLIAGNFRYGQAGWRQFALVTLRHDARCYLGPIAAPHMREVFVLILTV